MPLLRAAIAALGDSQRGLAMRLRAVLAAIAIHDARFAELREVMREELDQLVRQGGDEVVALLPARALALALEGSRCAEVARLVQRAYADPQDAAALYGQQMLVGDAGYALVFADALDTAQHFAAGVAAHAADHGAQLPHPLLIGYLALAAVERGEDDDSVAALLALPLARDLARTGLGLMLLGARGQVRLARGATPGAVADLRLAGDSAGRLGVGNPNVGHWSLSVAHCGARATQSSLASHYDERSTSPSGRGPNHLLSALGPKRSPRARGRGARGSAASKR